ncbi:MAG: hypothetical protein SAJ12_15720 [Jaaginema sp. PMC 1079.18]|nr:hypothetical protein [Jaaginema sp. PMC 1080.18]MEC4852432.1 hypothetical protein [Jaaginema sp. PMC 1079.18]MEC4865578.1 hypothetical protein [Jaaginema sp. PMC 1078.18]
MNSTFGIFPLLLPGALSDLFAQVSQTGQITLADRYGLMAAVMDENLSPEERASVDRILRATRQGRMQMIDELSCIYSKRQFVR